ncbi:hypothetical protein [Persephonella sp.]|uniref:hypothetical protein n=1 Tax=Persephonella sp. TaxID=2060922 RepID=UPI0025D4BE2A|nr:hypothetical protein [Persephonella sp.]
MRVAGSLATKLAPPFSLVLHYFTAGVLFNLIGIISLFLLSGEFNEPFFSFQYVAEVHLFLLGFVMMIIFGALYQLIPVALEIPVYSFKLGYIQFYVYIVGIILFVVSLLIRDFFPLLPLGALLLYISILIFIFNFFASLGKLEKFDITSKFLIVANLSLFTGVSIGIFLALNFVYGFYSGNIFHILLSHIIFTLFGFVFMVIMGVSMVLLPMFSLAHKFNDIYINISFYIMVVSVFGGGILALVLESPPVYYSVFLLIFSAFIFYLIQVFEIYRKRPRRTKDTGMDVMFFSHLFLFGSVFFGVLIPFSQKWIFLFGITLIFGFVNFLIYGSLYKIVPFLTWFHRFSPLVGKKKVPMLNEMLPKKIPDVQISVSVFGFLLLIASILLEFEELFTVSVLIMGLGSLLFGYVYIYVLKFKLEE